MVRIKWSDDANLADRVTAGLDESVHHDAYALKRTYAEPAGRVDAVLLIEGLELITQHRVRTTEQGLPRRLDRQPNFEVAGDPTGPGSAPGYAEQIKDYLLESWSSYGSVATQPVTSGECPAGAPPRTLASARP